jgi:hypothetical protein
MGGEYNGRPMIGCCWAYEAGMGGAEEKVYETFCGIGQKSII